MATTTKTNNLFTPQQTGELFDKVKVHSTIAKLSGSTPIPFAGTETMVFTMDGEASIVGEAGKKPAGDAAFSKVTITPVKVVYQHRLTDEFVNMAEQARLPYYSAFLDGFAKKIARAIDIMTFHGKNPATKEASTIIGNNHFDAKITNKVEATDDPAADLQGAIDEIVNNDREVSGIAMSPTFASDMGKLKQGSDSYVNLYPEFAFGGRPSSFNGMSVDVNKTVAFGASSTAGDANAVAYVGDFQNSLKWGYAENIPMEIIQYGNPDGQGDLKESNEIVLRAEAYIGWGVIDPDAFTRIVKTVPGAAKK